MEKVFKKRVELTTVDKLIKELKKLPKETEVYTNGTQGYMHIGEASVVFDDDPLELFYGGKV